MQYQNLQDLLFHSSSARQYFVSLPVPTQLSLHQQNDYIHTSAQLHIRAEEVEKYNRAAALSDTYQFHRK